jgi:hypothetical protein
VEYWPTFDPSILPAAAGRRAIMREYRELRDDLTTRIKNRFLIGGGPSV